MKNIALNADRLWIGVIQNDTIYLLINRAYYRLCRWCLYRKEVGEVTDNEIIKALEEHYRQVDAGYSTHLEYGGKGDEHEEKYIYMLRDTIDLINRLKAENERLEHSLLHETELLYDANEELKTAKSEAYKEFAEACKACFPSLSKVFDIILKEMG